MIVRNSTLFVLAFLLAGASNYQPSKAEDGPGAGAPLLRAERADVHTRPSIDGVLNEPIWATAEVAKGFVQHRPNPGQDATERTEVLVAYDETSLYVGFRNYDSDPDGILRQLARRGESTVSDKVFVGIDSYGDGRTAFVFGVNAAGVKYDVLLYDDVREDPSWDAVWDVAVGDLDEGGWTAEFRIPLSQLRYQVGDDPQEWGINFQRDIARKQEVSFWAPILPESGGLVSLFGRLQGIEGLRSSRRIEIQPYVATDLSRQPGDPANPFYQANAFGLAGGLDAKVGLTSTLTLSATVNPDFGQVEADPAVVNLTAFETFFSERRPFFVEGAEVFQFGRSRGYTAVFRPTYFYSRRIGRAPQRSLNHEGHLFVEAPDQTTIAAAGKVSGRVGSWSIGVLNAVTLEGTAQFLDQDGARGSTPVEPLTNYAVARLRRDLRGGQSVIGGMLTTTNRSLSNEAFTGLLAEQAYVGGIDFEHAWGDRAWAISGAVVGSTVSGSTDYISRLQRAPQRYMHRPDAEHLEFDDTRTHLSGASMEVGIARISGKLRGSMTLNAVTSGFEANDLGFQARADGYGVSGIILYNESEPGMAWLRNYGANVHAAVAANGDGDILHRAIGLNAFGQFSNFWSSSLSAQVAPLPVMSDRLTRGGPLAERPGEVSTNLRVESDQRRAVVGGLWTFVRTELAREPGSTANAGLDVTINPSTNLRLTLSPSLNTDTQPDQYVRTVVDPAADRTFGRRYVFAHLNQKSAALGIRANWTFAPTLSLQLYARPFIAAGRYSSFKEFERPAARQFAVYGEDRGDISTTNGGYIVDPGDGGATFSIANPDFSFRSLRANAVVRWEYRPGSTVFFVWQQQRSAFDPEGTFNLARDMAATLADPVHNVFLIKLTYWLGM